MIGHSPRILGWTSPISESAWWALPLDKVLSELATTNSGLSSQEVAARLANFGTNQVRPHEEATVWGVFFAQFRSPLKLILVFAALVSGVVSEWLDAVIIVAIVIGSAVIGFFQEYRASNAVAELRARVQLQVRVRRDGVIKQVPGCRALRPVINASRTPKCRSRTLSVMGETARDLPVMRVVRHPRRIRRRMEARLPVRRRAWEA